MLRRSQFRFFATPDPVKQQRYGKLTGTGFFGSPMRGRTSDSHSFETRIRLIGAQNVRHEIAWPLVSPAGEKLTAAATAKTCFDPLCTVVADFVTLQEVVDERLAQPHPMPIFSESTVAGIDNSKCLELDYTLRRRLQQQADAAAIRVPLSEKTHANVILVVEPDVRSPEFLQSEAQVELITAFRNMMMEFFELSCPESLHRTRWDTGKQHDPAKPPQLRTLRIPALSHQMHEGKFDLSIDKMHQRALIQAFHRCSRDMKDWFSVYSHVLTFELFVPQPLLPGFQRAFLDEAWPTPKSALLPERRSYYQELQMPESLLESAPGFIGERDEIKALALPYEERHKLLAEIEAARKAQDDEARLLAGESQPSGGEALRIEVSMDQVSFSSSRADQGSNLFK